jgi:hypothetical protein
VATTWPLPATRLKRSRPLLVCVTTNFIIDTSSGPSYPIMTGAQTTPADRGSSVGAAVRASVSAIACGIGGRRSSAV